MDFEQNQVQDENVFDDATVEEENLFADETTEDTPEVEEPVEEAPKTFLRVKYNDEEQDLNEDDARMYAQKGMNYDKIYNPLQKLAKANGLQVGEYLHQLEATQRQYEISQEVDRLRQDEKYADLSDEILEEIANSRIEKIVSEEAQIKAEEQSNQEKLVEQELKRQVDMFQREYPNVKPEEVSDEVIDLVKQGYTLLEAYHKWDATNAKQIAKRQNEENKKRSLGNTTNAGKVDSDDFLNGFLNG